MPQTPRLALPLIAAGQAQKDVTHNDALLALDRLVALTIASRSAAGPPSVPLPGECHVVAASAAAAWGEPAGTLMHWQGGGWQGGGWLAEAPRAGQVALVADEGLLLVHDGDWQALWPVSGLRIAGRDVLAAPPASIALPNGGAAVDAEARATLAALVAALQAQGIVA